MKQALSTIERLVLELLDDGERYGLALVTASGGRLKRGTVYVTLARMEAVGLVTSRQEEAPADRGGPPRRLYRRTPGAVALLSLQASVSEALAAAVASKAVQAAPGALPPAPKGTR